MSPIEALESLSKRWPRFFDVMRASNGVGDPVPYEVIQTLNEKIMADTEGVEILVRALAQLMQGASEEEARWLSEQGFLDSSLVGLADRIGEIEKEMDSTELDTSRAIELIKELEELRDRVEAVNKAARRFMARGFARLEGIIQ